MWRFLMKPSYNVWILKKKTVERETDIIGVFFNRELVEQAKKEIEENTNWKLVIWAANAFDPGF